MRSYVFLILIALSGLSIIGLASCVSTPLTKADPCVNRDWYEIGRQDGVNGELPSSFEYHKQACAGSAYPPKLDLYLGGRNAGLVEYCTPQSGLEAGKTGRTYNRVCPEQFEKSFLAAFEVGRRVYLLEIENADIGTRMQDIFERLSRGTSTVTDETVLQSRLEELKRRRAENETQINEIESGFFQTL